MGTIYFDYNATTPLDPGVREAMLPFLAEEFGNPSSIHQVGRRARAFLDEAREKVAVAWACKPSQIVFTSGGTECNNLALFGVARRLRDRGRHLITSAVEHHSVLHPCQHLVRHEGFQLTVLTVDSDGRVDPAAVKAALRPDTVLVSIMAANNEIGTIQPVAEIGAICRDAGVIFHTDAAQWFGKEPLRAIAQFQASLVTCCAHKLHGPKGTGALFVQSPETLDPFLLGGSHENDRRAGTENVAAIVGLADALAHFINPPVFPSSTLSPLTRTIRDRLCNLEGVTIRSPVEGCLRNTVAFSVRGADGTALIAALDLEGICASSGSACSAGSLEPSHVLLAIGASPEESHSLVRISLGRESTLGEVERLLDVLPSVIRRTTTH